LRRRDHNAGEQSWEVAAVVEQRRIPMAEADPYLLFGLLGKQVIHPGGRKATEELLGLAELAPGQQVLDIGCGAGKTAIEMATRFQAIVTAADISDDMRDRAIANVRAAGVGDRISVEAADICALPYEDGRFDRVVAEAVTMFVDRDLAIRELVRVCRPGGLVLATEFHWRRPPTPEARQAFLGEVCPGMLFETVEDWLARYGSAGLTNLEIKTGPFDMMTARGFVADEGVRNAVRVMARAIANTTARRRMIWLVPRISRAVPYLGYMVIRGRRPVGEEDAG
jgi:SAM-dependent methyltransferase